MISLIEAPVRRIIRKRIISRLNDPSKRPWSVSLILALCAHSLFLFGTAHAAFLKSPQFGVQGSAGSMEIYMVVALPDAPIQPAAEISPAVAPALQNPENSIAVKEKARRKKATVKGDGSSPVPGRDAATLISSGSASIPPRAGRFQNRAPEYPAIAQERGQEGLVMLKVRVNKEGNPAQVKVTKSSGHAILDEEALKAVRRWKFEPAQIGPVTIESDVNIPVRFSLEE